MNTNENIHYQIHFIYQFISSFITELSYMNVLYKMRPFNNSPARYQPKLILLVGGLVATQRLKRDIIKEAKSVKR